MKSISWLDSSAILALFWAEPGHEHVTHLLEQAQAGKRTLYASQLSLTEVAASVARSFNETMARDDLRLLREMPLGICAPTDDQCVAAGLLRAQHRLSTADAIIATQAVDARAELVHKDPEFEAVPGLNQHRLPYKTRRR
jgi:ribonuclease VapC